MQPVARPLARFFARTLYRPLSEGAALARPRVTRLLSCAPAVGVVRCPVVNSVVSVDGQLRGVPDVASRSCRWISWSSARLWSFGSQSGMGSVTESNTP